MAWPKLGSRRLGLSAAQKHFSVGAFAAGVTGVTIQNQIPVPRAVTGFRAVFTNGTTTASAVSGFKAAAADTDAHTGASLTYISGTFDGSASGTLPAIWGVAPHDVRTLLVSDHVSLKLTALQWLIIRTYFTGSGCAEQPAAGEFAAFRTATGLKYKCANALGVIADATAMTVTEGQLICPAGVIWTTDIESETLAAVGGSTLRGQGSSANATGLIYKAAADLTTSRRFYSPYVAAISGQGSIASMNNAKQVIEKIRPDYLVMFPGSGNDTDLSSAGFDAMRGRLANQLDMCRRYGVIPILGTLAPSTELTAGQELLRLAQNTETRAWAARGHGILADVALAVEDPANRAQLLPAYDTDGTHFNDAGHTAAAAPVTAAVRRAL